MTRYGDGSLTKEAKIEFNYEVKGFASISPIKLKERRIQRMKKMERVGRLYRIPYQQFPRGVVVDTSIEDLRPFGIRLGGKYGGRITIELIEIVSGGAVTVMSLDSRTQQPHQWVYRYRDGRKSHDVWLGMPNAKFRVVMELNMPSQQFNAINETQETLEKITKQELAELMVETTVERLNLLFESGIDDFDDSIRTITDDVSLDQVTKTREFLSSLIGENGIEESYSVLEELLNENSGKRKEFEEYFINNLKEDEIRKKWARALGDLDQELKRKSQEPGKKKKETKIRRRARRDLKTIKKSERALEDVFEIFRFYLNTYLMAVKYSLGQYWIKTIPSWELDFFYHENEILMNGEAIINQPMYRVGDVSMHPPTDNLFVKDWKRISDLSFGQMMEISTGFTTDGIFVKAYDSLLDDNGEVCIALLDIGLEHAFRYLRRGISEEAQKSAEMIGLPNTSDTDLSFGDIITLTCEPFGRNSGKFGFSRTRINKLWKHMEFIHELRNRVLHRKTIVRKHIHLALTTQDTSYLNPRDYEIDLEIDPNNIHHLRPYWWRVLSCVYHSAIDIHQALNLFKLVYLSDNDVQINQETTSTEKGLLEKMKHWLKHISSRMSTCW
jgi:hypothetical protein